MSFPIRSFIMRDMRNYLIHVPLSGTRRERSKRSVKTRRIFSLSFFAVTVLFAVIALSEDGTDYFSRSLPAVQANLLFNGYSETPVGPKTEWVCQGHLTCTRLYDPVEPGHTEKAELWDAGEVLDQMEPCDRRIYFPDIRLIEMVDVTIAVGDGNKRNFCGALQHPVVANTVRISDGQETFNNEKTKDLLGDQGGTGNLNRFTGEFEITFKDVPGNGVPIQCSYTCQRTGTCLLVFDRTNIDNVHLALDKTYDISDEIPYDFNGDGNLNESDGDYLVQWTLGYSDGISIRKPWLLGAIKHSASAVIGPPGKPPWYYGTRITEDERRDFDSFLEAKKKRRTVVYVGAEDGMLHAFDAGRFRWDDNPQTDVVEQRGYFEWIPLASDFSFDQRWHDLLARYKDPPPEFLWQSNGDGDKAPDYGSGKELWAFIPPSLLPRLKNNLLGKADYASMDASPVIVDVYVRGQWRTILLAAEANGCDALFCLDITDPDEPSFLWEFSDPDLMRATSLPAAGKVGLIALDGIKRWVAFFVSGDTSGATWDPSLYVVDISDGSLIRRVFLHAGMDRNGDGMDDGLGGIPCAEPAVVDSDGNGYVDRIYVGTDKGFMFRLTIPDEPDFPGSVINSCMINRDFSYEDGDSSIYTVPEAQRFHPIYTSPTVVVDNRYDEDMVPEFNIRVFFGTGDNPYLDEGMDMESTTYHFFAYVDHSPKGECGSDTFDLIWYRSLAEGHRIFAPAFAAAGTVYFGTSTQETCDLGSEDGSGRIYAVDMVDGSVTFEKEVGDIIATPLVEDEHLYVKAGITGGNAPIIIGGGHYNNDVVRNPAAAAGFRAWKELW